jgi:hypothetical protein
MTSPNPPEPPASEAREAAANRRRWITLAEVLAVAGLAISGLALWNNYSERNATEAERAAEKQEQAAEKQKEKAKAQTLVLKAAAAKGGKSLTLSALDPAQAIQSQTIAFPAALGAKAVETVIDPRIESGWVERAAKQAKEAQKKGTSASGDRRIPVAITSRFVSGGETHADTALYDIGYKLEEGGLLGGTEVTLLGLSRIERVDAKKAQARLDALWASRTR